MLLYFVGFDKLNTIQFEVKQIVSNDPMRYTAPSFFILLCFSKSIFAEALLTCDPTYEASTNLHTQSNVDNNPEVVGDDLVVPANSVVGSVYITRLPIFDESDPGENKLIFRWANRFHILTTPKTIEQELLFESGSPYESRVIEESGRLLRAANFLYDSTIKPVSHCNGVTTSKLLRGTSGRSHPRRALIVPGVTIIIAYH